MQGIRGILSCTSCRQRKLRCDRNEPCSNCTTRNIDCIYASLRRGHGNSTQRGDNSHHPEARIRRLEQLIGTIVAQSPEKQGSKFLARSRDSEQTNNLNHGNSRNPNSHQQTANDSSRSDHIAAKPGRMMSTDDQHIYVSDVHWAAICNEISYLKEHLNQEGLASQTEVAPQGYTSSEPLLLKALPGIFNIEDALSDIPPRDLTNRLIFRYFNSKDPSLSTGILSDLRQIKLTIHQALFHAPAFQIEYKRFWNDPHSVSITWVSLFFGLMAFSVFLHIRSGDELPATFGNPVQLKEMLHRRSTECLVASKYATEPSIYTIEALLFNIQNEFVQRRDSYLGVWILSGIATRLAIRMGYHRDPGNYPQFSVFNAEMRRRVWAIILQMDALISCQLGLLSMIQETQYDTKLPCNLLDEDFNLDSTELPQPRPETELTPVLYTITKTRFLLLFRTIFNQVSIGYIRTYDEVLALDQRLNNAHNLISPQLQLASLEDCLTLPPYLLIQRYNLELLFQKSRCILHRHHMAKSYQDSTFNFSRYSCVEAAMAILTHQANIYKEVQVGGLLYREKWFVSSLEQHDFLLASMIVCLELSSLSYEQPSILEHNERIGFSRFDRQQLIKALEASQSFWYQFKSSSVEAQQAFTLLSLMLDKAPTGTEADKQQNLPTRDVEHCNDNNASQHEDGDINLGLNPLQSIRSQSEVLPQMATSPFHEAIGTFLNSPHTIDWNAWELFIQDTRPSGTL